MKNVIYLVTENMTANQVLDGAKQLNLADVIVLGYDADGGLTLRSSKMTKAEALFLLKLTEKWVLEGQQ